MKIKFNFLIYNTQLNALQVYQVIKAQFLTLFNPKLIIIYYLVVIMMDKLFFGILEILKYIKNLIHKNTFRLLYV